MKGTLAEARVSADIKYFNWKLVENKLEKWGYLPPLISENSLFAMHNKIWLGCDESVFLGAMGENWI